MSGHHTVAQTTTALANTGGGLAPARRARKLDRLESARAPALRLADRIIDEGRRRQEAQERRGPASRADKRRARLMARNPVTARDQAVETAKHIVDDPYQPGAKVDVEINRRVDILEMEKGHRRISVAAYLTGREVQAVFERAARQNMPARNWMGGDRVDSSAAHETQILKGIDAATACEAEMRRLKAAVGEVGARFLREIIADGVSFADYATRRGRGGERGTAYVADRFRAMLEDLAEFRAARGRG